MNAIMIAIDTNDVPSELVDVVKQALIKQREQLMDKRATLMKEHDALGRQLDEVNDALFKL